MSLENNTKFKYLLTSELCSKVTDGTHDTPKEVEFGKKLVTSKNILGGKLNLDNSYFISIDDYNKINERSKVDKWDLLLYMIGVGVGEVALVKEEPDFAIKNLGLLKNKNETNAKWLYYYLRSPEGQYQIKTRVQGSTQPYIPLKELKRLEIPIPTDNNYLKYCVHILDNIDKKIEVTEEINKNLTKLIDTSFKNYLLNFENYSEEYLVSSEFGPIPKGWEVNNLTGIADYQNGLAMQKFPPENPEDSFKVLKIKELRQGFLDESSDSCSKNIKEECIVYDGDVIFSWSGSLLVDIWTGGICGLNQHLFKVTSSNFDKWFYYCWTKFYLDQFILIAKDKATTMGHIKRQHLEESLVLIPDNETYNDLTNLFKPLFEYLIKNKIEIKKLQSLRDTLLPKLMSGEIDVSKINCDLMKFLFIYLFLKLIKFFFLLV